VPKSRNGIWIAVILVPIGLVLLFIPSLYVYMSVTAKPIHPNPAKAPSVTQSAPPPPTWQAAIEQARDVTRTHLSEKNLPGLSVAVGIGGDLVWAEGFGFADLDNRQPVTPDHKFRIGTASTVLTSAALGLLLEDRRLNLDDPIQKYVPEYPRKQWPVSVRRLMGHQGGLEFDGGDENPLLGKHCEQPVDAIPVFANQSLAFEPGTGFRFSSYGWIVLSAAVEAAVKEPFLVFMQERVFDPLGMRDTVPESATESIPNRVTPYFPRFMAKPTYGPETMRDLDYSCYAGASVFLSTPSDLVRFAMAIDRGKLLKPATVQLLQTSQRLPSGEETGYGLGWDLETITLTGGPARAVGHDGDILGGMVSSLLAVPDRGIVVAVISNTSYAETFSLAEKIAQAFAQQTAAR
jgi:CubicO group peptidase (beta-lactamase class C family)